MLLLDGGQAADAAGQDDAGGFGFRFGIQTTVRKGFLGCTQRQQGKAGHLAGFLFVHHRFRVKVFHFARQLALEIGGVELGNGADAALASLGSGPAVGHIIAQRVHGAEAGDDDSAFFHAKFSFYIAMPPSAQSTCPVR